MPTASDRLDILDVIARWSHAVDGDDPSALTEVLSDDTVLQIGNAAPVEGREAVIAWLGERMATRDAQTRRHVRNTVIDEIDDSRATARTYYLITGVAPGGRPEPIATGVYHDEVVRTADGWRIRSRRARPDGTGTREPRA